MSAGTTPSATRWTGMVVHEAPSQLRPRLRPRPRLPQRASPRRTGRGRRRAERRSARRVLRSAATRRACGLRVEPNAGEDGTAASHPQLPVTSSPPARPRRPRSRRRGTGPPRRCGRGTPSRPPTPRHHPRRWRDRGHARALVPDEARQQGDESVDAFRIGHPRHRSARQLIRRRDRRQRVEDRADVCTDVPATHRCQSGLLPPPRLPPVEIRPWPCLHLTLLNKRTFAE